MADEKDALDRAVDAVIKACDGDARAALKALIIANQFMQDELQEAKTATSKGYRRKAC